MTYEATRPDCI